MYTFIINWSFSYEQCQIICIFGKLWKIFCDTSHLKLYICCFFIHIFFLPHMGRTLSSQPICLYSRIIRYPVTVMCAPSEDEFQAILRDPYRDDPQWQPWHDEKVIFRLYGFNKYEYM
jgi:hypothetical protein